MAYDMYVLDEVHEADGDYDPMLPDEPGYYRLNRLAMQVMVQIMLRAGLLDAEVSHKPWPKWLPQGMDVPRADELLEHYLVGLDITPPPTREESDATTAYLAQRSEVQATPSPISGLVPAFKFRSNDQWHVTPAECLIVAHGLRVALESRPALILPDPQETGLTGDQAREFVLRWASFNDFAAGHGGYRVH